MQLRIHDHIMLDSIERRTHAKSPTDLRALFINSDSTKSLDRLRKAGLLELRGENYVITYLGRQVMAKRSPEAIAEAMERNAANAVRRKGYTEKLKHKQAIKRRKTKGKMLGEVQDEEWLNPNQAGPA